MTLSKTFKNFGYWQWHKLTSAKEVKLQEEFIWFTKMSTVEKWYPLRYPAEDKANQHYVPDLPEGTRNFRVVPQDDPWEDPRDFKNEQANTDFFSGYCGTEDYSLNCDKIKLQVNSYVVVTSLEVELNGLVR